MRAHWRNETHVIGFDAECFVCVHQMRLNWRTDMCATCEVNDKFLEELADQQRERTQTTEQFKHNEWRTTCNVNDKFSEEIGRPAKRTYISDQWNERFTQNSRFQKWYSIC